MGIISEGYQEGEHRRRRCKNNVSDDEPDERDDCWDSDKLSVAVG